MIADGHLALCRIATYCVRSFSAMDINWIRTLLIKIHTFTLLVIYTSAATEWQIKLNTSRFYQYRYLEDFGFSLDGDQYVSFVVKTAKEAHIALSKFRDPHAFTYEVVIGDNDNTRSFIRDCTQCRPHAQLYHSPLDDRRYTGFWISWDAGTIRLGKGTVPYKYQILIWRDPHPHDVRHVAVSTGWGLDTFGRWIFGKVQMLPPPTTTPTQTEKPKEAANAVFIGIPGVAFVAIVVTCMILVDLPTFWLHFHYMRDNIRDFKFTIKEKLRAQNEKNNDDREVDTHVTTENMSTDTDFSVIDWTVVRGVPQQINAVCSEGLSVNSEGGQMTSV